MILYGNSLESVIFSVKNLESIGIEGVRNREKKTGIPCCETLKKSGIPAPNIGGGRLFVCFLFCFVLFCFVSFNLE